MSARQQKQHGKMYITYMCNAHSRGFCDSTGFSHKKLENAFLEYLDTLRNIEPTDEIMQQQKKYLIYQKKGKK